MDSTAVVINESHANPISFDSVAKTIQNIINSWSRRQKWRQIFNPKQQEEQPTNKAAWRISLSNFLESTLASVIAISLLLLDLILTSLEISLSLISCSSEKKWSSQQGWIHWFGIAILSLLSIKSVGLAIGLGFDFFRKPGYILDGVVVIGALVMESVLEKKGAGFVVVVSLWRVVRVLETAFELSDEAIRAQVDGIICEFEVLKDENKRLLEMIVEKDEVIQKLCAQLDRYRHNTKKISFLQNI